MSVERRRLCSKPLVQVERTVAIDVSLRKGRVRLRLGERLPARALGDCLHQLHPLFAIDDRVGIVVKRPKELGSRG